MSKVSYAKMVFKHKATNSYLENLLLRFYEQIISGFWAVMILMPIEQITYTLSGRAYNANYFNWKYLLLFVVYTVFFFVSSIAIPRVRAVQLRRQLNEMVKVASISIEHKHKTNLILKESLVCKSFFTKEGFWQFTMINLFGFAIVAAYYGFEDTVSIIAANSDIPIAPAIVFWTIFVSSMALMWWLDNNLSMKMCSNNANITTSGSRSILINVLRLFTRDYLDGRFNMAIWEDILDDICEILKLETKDDDQKVIHKT